MCGIAGLTGENHQSRIKAMAGIMAYRGPDDEGYYSDGAISLAHRRLSINDLEGGRQPIANEDGSIVLLCNGEIYNSPELRSGLMSRGHAFKTKTDVEVILHLYEECKEKCFSRLRGMFAVAIWDSREQRLVLARDHLGQKPLFFCTKGNEISFASEPKAVLASGLPGREIDMEGLWHYISLRYLPDDKSLFKNVRKLPAATYAVWQKGKIVQDRYWRLDTFKDKRTGTDRELEDELEAILLDTVKMHLLSDVPVGTFLSGGIDSSLVTAMTAKLRGGEKLSAFSIGVNDQINELPWAKMIADSYNLDWRTETVEADLIGTIPEMIFHMDEPADPFGVGVYLVSGVAARNNCKVVLSGDGGDENFAGYDRFAGQKLARMYGAIPSFVRSSLLAPMIDLIPESFGYKSLAGKLRWLNDVGGHAKSPAEAYARSMSVLRFTKEAKDALFTEKAAGMVKDTDSDAKIFALFEDGTATEYLDKMLYTDLMTRIPDQLLAISDRMSMAHSIEIRPPLIDYKVTEFAASLPARAKLRGTGRGLKYILRQVAKRYMSGELVDRPKQGFGFPIAKWLRTDLASFQRNLFKESRFIEAGLFSGAYVNRLLDEHIGGKADHNFRLWILVNLEFWHRIAIEGQSVDSCKETIARLMRK